MNGWRCRGLKVVNYLRIWAYERTPLAVVLCSEVDETHEMEQVACQTDDQTAVVRIYSFFLALLSASLNLSPNRL